MTASIDYQIRLFNDNQARPVFVISHCSEDCRCCSWEYEELDDRRMLRPNVTTNTTFKCYWCDEEVRPAK